MKFLTVGTEAIDGLPKGFESRRLHWLQKQRVSHGFALGLRQIECCRAGGGTPRLRPMVAGLWQQRRPGGNQGSGTGALVAIATKG